MSRIVLGALLYHLYLRQLLLDPVRTSESSPGLPYCPRTDACFSSLISPAIQSDHINGEHFCLLGENLQLSICQIGQAEEGWRVSEPGSMQTCLEICRSCLHPDCYVHLV